LTNNVEIDVRTSLRVDACSAQLLPESMSRTLTGDPSSKVVCVTAQGMTQQPLGPVWIPETARASLMLRIPELAQLLAHLEQCANSLTSYADQIEFRTMLALARRNAASTPTYAVDVNAEIDRDTSPAPDGISIDFTAGTVNGKQAPPDLAAFLQGLTALLAPLGEHVASHSPEAPASTQSENSPCYVPGPFQAPEVIREEQARCAETHPGRDCTAYAPLTDGPAPADTDHHPQHTD
jgi:hypothetical protein